jgi:subtilisin
MEEMVMADPTIERYLDNFGFDQVIAVLDDKAAPPAGASTSMSAKAAAEAPVKSEAKRCGKEVLSLFLSDVPEAACGAAAGLKPTSKAGARSASGTTTPAARYFPLLGIVVGYVDRSKARNLAKHRDVKELFHAYQPSIIRPVNVAAAKAKTKTTWGLRKLGIEALWKEGLTGKGVAVGHLDTGVDGKHPAIKSRLAAFMEFDLQGNRVPGSSPHDSDDHGTHTAGTICGGKSGGLSIGVAPKAELHSGLVIEGGEVLFRILAGMEWILEQNVRVLSMSLGFRGFTPFFLAVTQRLRDRGVLPVFAIGNEGVGTSRSPGNYAEALSVGAIDINSRVANFSGSIKFTRPVEPDQPNIVAPGVDVISARPGGGVQSMSGTSMATPHAAGIAALLFQAKPDASVAQVEEAIQTTCTRLPNDTPLRYGFGLVCPHEALKKLKAI